MSTDLLTAEQAAPLRNVCPDTIRRWHREGWLKHHAIYGRTVVFKRKDVLAANPPSHGGKRERKPK